jgi:hypothetical protein
MPEPYTAAIAELGAAKDAFLCRQAAVQSNSSSSSSNSSNSSSSTSCGFISTSRSCIQKHTNLQHSIYLSRWSSPTTFSYQQHAAQLWEPVKVQT